MFDHDTIVGPLQTSVQQRLEDLTRSVRLCDNDQAADLARREIPLLVQALRSVLDTHEPDTRGRCRICREPRSRLPFRRHPRLPCRAYLAVQLRLGTVEKLIPRRRPVASHRRRGHLHSVG